MPKYPKKVYGYYPPDESEEIYEFGRRVQCPECDFTKSMKYITMNYLKKELNDMKGGRKGVTREMIYQQSGFREFFAKILADQSTPSEKEDNKSNIRPSVGTFNIDEEDDNEEDDTMDEDDDNEEDNNEEDDDVDEEDDNNEENVSDEGDDNDGKNDDDEEVDDAEENKNDESDTDKSGSSH